MNTTTRLTAAAALVRFLKAQYVARDGKEQRLIEGVFGIFGHGNVAGLGQALQEYGGSELPFHQPKNEQAMVHTAIAFSKTRRGLGTFACTTSVGPGATNLVTGAATATINRLPVLLLPGDIFANRRPAPVLQQLENPLSQDISVNDCLKPVSRYWDRINRPEQLLTALPEAMRALATPELAGAVTLALPEDVQAEAFDCPNEFFAKRVISLRRREAAREDIAEAVAWLKRARRPLVIAGGGVHYSDAGQALLALAQSSGIPVAVTQAGKIAVAAEHSVGAIGTTGTLAANAIAERADLVLAIGTRLSDFTTASKTQFRAEGVRFIGINVNDTDARKHGALPLVGDARAVLEQLAQALGGHRVSEDFRREIAELKEKWQAARAELTRSAEQLGQAQVIRCLNEALDARSTIVHAAGGLPGDLHKLWNVRAPGDYHSEYGYSCMGYEIAGALGVKLAAPEREVYALLGDGSYLMLNHELVTSIQEGIKLTAVVLDNAGYQCIHRLQKSCGGSSFGNEFRDRDGSRLPVDLAANAASLGAEVFRAATEAELAQALEAARHAKKSAVIVVTLREDDPGLPGYSWWDVPVAEVSEQQSVKKARAAYEEARKKQRFYY